MTVTISVTFNRFPEIAERLPREASAVVRKTAFDIEAAAKQIVPVDTGTLKNSIQTGMQPGEITAIVGAGDETSSYGKTRKDGSISRSVTPSAEYAVFVEFGARRTAARPFMTPAAEANRGPFVQAMTQLLQQL